MELLTEENIHQRVVIDTILEAKNTVWIATANLKDMHVRGRRGYHPILQTFNDMVKNGISFRVIHSDMPSKPFMGTIDQYPLLIQNFELQICKRCHWKIVIVDGTTAYFGSANFTGAGLGVRGINKRNLEVGALTTDKEWVLQLETKFDEFWIGKYCGKCAVRSYCPDPIDD